MAFKPKDIAKFPDWVQRQIKDHLNENRTDNKNEGNTNPKQERSGQKALDMEGKAPAGMVNITGKVVVRITRISARRLDDDNFSGGSKQIRDAIAAMLGRKGDSEADGFKWEYVQEKGETETKIEIYRR